MGQIVQLALGSPQLYSKRSCHHAGVCDGRTHIRASSTVRATTSLVRQKDTDEACLFVLDAAQVSRVLQVSSPRRSLFRGMIVFVDDVTRANIDCGVLFQSVCVSFCSCTSSTRSRLRVPDKKCISPRNIARCQMMRTIGTCGMTSLRYCLFVTEDMVHGVLIEVMDGTLVLRTSVRRTLPRVYLIRGSCNTALKRVWRNLIEKHIAFVI